jgi:hypothetical protein
MRKILLGTTAVVGLALVAQAANAQGISPGQAQGTTLTAAPAPSMAGAGGLSVRLGGYYEFSGANIQDDNDRATRLNAAHGKARQRNDFRNDMELNVFVDGRAANGMQYGAVLEMQMDAQADTTVDFDEMYGFFKGTWGEFRFGQEDSAASLLIVRAPAAGALGGDAVWDEFVVILAFSAALTLPPASTTAMTLPRSSICRRNSPGLTLAFHSRRIVVKVNRQVRSATASGQRLFPALCLATRSP